MHNLNHYKTLAFSLVLLVVTALVLPGVQAKGNEGTEDREHAQALKDFVPDHPHLHDLVDKTGEGDEEAKLKFEREALSARYAKVKEKLPPGTDDARVALHFIDDYTRHVTGGDDNHSMDLWPFLSLLEKEKEVLDKIAGLGKLIESGECDFTCFGDNLTKFMNESIEKIATHIEL